jgi:hypothetical protein
LARCLPRLEAVQEGRRRFRLKAIDSALLLPATEAAYGMKEQLAKMLEGLAPGETFILGYDLFDSIWPSGSADQKAMSDFSLFAENYRCDINNLPGQRIIVLAKRQPATA